MLSYTSRLLTSADEPSLWLMLMHAAHESSLNTVQQHPSLSCYVKDWGRPGDLGYGTFADDQVIGAAWCRRWAGAAKGYGYLDEEIPELAIAVSPSHQGSGIGTHLLQQVLNAARDRYPAISLNVRADNPAVRLYQRAGFVPVAGSELTNRVGGISFNMVCYF